MNPTSRPDAHPEALASGQAEDQRDPATAVTALYHEHALSLIRLAHIMLGNQAAAEDVVHDAFLGLYRRWEHLVSADKALSYVRASVVNGCRSTLRGSARLDFSGTYHVAAMSAEAAVLTSEDHRQLISALRQLPHRQRSVLVLRYYLDVSDDQIAKDMAVSLSTVRSTRRRGIAALRRALKETS